MKDSCDLRDLKEKKMEMEVYGVGSREFHMLYMHYNC